MKPVVHCALNLLSIVAAIGGVRGCDPGWHYRAESGRPINEHGLRFNVATPSGLKLRVYASAFTGRLGVKVDLFGLGITQATESAFSFRSTIPKTTISPALILDLNENDAFLADGQMQGSLQIYSFAALATTQDQTRRRNWLHRNPSLDRITALC